MTKDKVTLTRITEEDIRKAFEEWLPESAREDWFYGWLADFGAELDKVADVQLAQDKRDHKASLEQERRAIGEWLESKRDENGFYDFDFLRFIKALKQGKRPEGMGGG